jgi:hypothetical protein
MTEHPDLLRLDALRAGEGLPGDAAHVDACESCRATLESMRGAAAELAAASSFPGSVPTEIDRAILSMTPRRPLPIRWLATAAVFVAAISLVILLQPTPRELARAAHDIDGNGTVDIVDAYTLALRIKRGDPLDGSWDLNRDGAVDRADVDAIAMRSVALGGSH